MRPVVVASAAVVLWAMMAARPSRATVAAVPCDYPDRFVGEYTLVVVGSENPRACAHRTGLLLDARRRAVARIGPLDWRSKVTDVPGKAVYWIRQGVLVRTDFRSGRTDVAFDEVAISDYAISRAGAWLAIKTRAGGVYRRELPGGALRRVATPLRRDVIALGPTDAAPLRLHGHVRLLSGNADDALWLCARKGNERSYARLEGGAARLVDGSREPVPDCSS